MIYACEHCRFTFSRAGTIEICPNCEKTAVREATKEEEEEYNKKQSLQEEGKTKTMGTVNLKGINGMP